MQRLDQHFDAEIASVFASASHQHSAAYQEVRRLQNELLNQDNSETAERITRDWINAHADSVDNYVARLELARILFWRWKNDEAEKVTTILAEERVVDTWTKSLLGQIRVRQQRNNEAERLFKAALALDASNHEARSFMTGHVLDDVEKARALKTHYQLSWHGRIELAKLYDVIEFKRRSSVSLCNGPLTQSFFDRANLAIDCISLGEKCSTPWAIDLREIEKIVFYTASTIGDATLSLAAVDAFAKYFEMFPEERRTIEIVSPYAALFEGWLASGGRDSPIGRIRALVYNHQNDHDFTNLLDDVRKQPDRTLLLLGVDPALINNEWEKSGRKAASRVELHIDRLASGLLPWQSLKQPSEHITSYPAKINRMVEMLLGCCLAVEPSRPSVNIPPPAWAHKRAQQLMEDLRLQEFRTIAVVECASIASKRLSPERLQQILHAIKEWAGTRPEDYLVMFCTDPDPIVSLADECRRISESIGLPTVVLDGDLHDLASLFVHCDFVISVDTGLAHVAASYGVPVLIMYAAADPYLWTTGGANVSHLIAPPAQTAHRNLTPVNMHVWENPRPILQTAMTSQHFYNELSNFLKKRFDDIHYSPGTNNGNGANSRTLGQDSNSKIT
jgi:ADP-heptose:LPS heptosyltransferase